jgi:Tfp pilus assembly protein PilN
MVKINLLDSVTERAEGSVAVVEAKVTNPNSKMALIGVGVAAVLVLAMLFSYLSAVNSRRKAQEDLAREQETKRKMEEIIKEMNDLEKKTKDISARIDAIKKLRASQQGPVAVLSAINERIPNVNDFFLESVDQKAGGLTITGNSPSEAAVTQFGRSLEFSSGLFSNVNIETQRKDFAGESRIAAAPAPGKLDNKAETVSFKITCRYTPPTPTMPANNNQSAAPKIAQNASSSAPGAQVAQR